MMFLVALVMLGIFVLLFHRSAASGSVCRITAPEDPCPRHVDPDPSCLDYWYEGCGCCKDCTCKQNNAILRKYEHHKDFTKDDKSGGEITEDDMLYHRGKCYCRKNCQCSCVHIFSGRKDIHRNDIHKCLCDSPEYEHENAKRRQAEEKMNAEREKRRMEEIERTRPKGKTVRCGTCGATGLVGGSLCTDCKGWGRIESYK